MRFPLAAAPVSAALAALCLAGCAPIPVPNPVAPRTSGIVRDAETNKPIAGAIVAGERAGFHCKTRSNQKGQYTLPAITQWSYFIYLGDPGVFPAPWWQKKSRMIPYTITARASGYLPALEGYLPSGETVTLGGAAYPPMRIDFPLKSAGQ
ncbi:MAG TPA: carboxypeptidase-like regulatory domain-containing protein [Chthoniobacteraceae bacterium]|jgi:hypothetical protein|nr:carboxypeptidase-like regulatory domain-containing protein [Chthoniobacteraceae bacterium]